MSSQPLTRGEAVVCYGLMLLAIVGVCISLEWHDQGRQLAAHLMGWPSLLLLLFCGEWQR